MLTIDENNAYLSETGPSLEWPAWLLLPVVFGYVTMTRSFAHLGVAPLYIGEATLVLLLFFRPEMILGTWLHVQLRPSKYSYLAIWSAIFVAYGLLELARGLSQSGYPKSAIQNFGFNYYIAFLFAGMWLGDRHRSLLPRVIWYLAWANAIYGIIYLLEFGHRPTPEEYEANIIPFWGWPAGAAISILGLLAFKSDTRQIILPLLLNGFVLFGRQVRAEWVAFAVAITLFSVLRGRLSRLLQVAGLIGGLLLVGVIVDFKIPAPASLGDAISTRDIVGRAVAIVDDDAAAQLSERADVYSGNVTWRSEWWSELLKVTHKRLLTTVFGMGYGYPIWDHNSLSEGINPTPHNIFIYVLTYTGWLGVFIFYTLQLYLASLLWKEYRASDQPFGICLWLLLFVWAHFDNRLETPYGAIPFYTLIGMALTSVHATTSSIGRPFLHLEAAATTRTAE
jgi:hypothetical protein